MISALLPTRQRAEKAAASVASLYAKAADRQGVEVLVGLDPDDDRDLYRSHLAGLGNVRLYCAETRHGYRRLHLYYNHLARHAQGDWLLLWNDDAEMTTSSWDRIVESHEQNVVLSPDNPHRPIPAFPIVPRRFVAALGHFSLGPHNDIWWQDIADALCILRWIDVRVEHHRPDLTGRPADSVHDERGHWLQQQYDELGDELQQDIATIHSLI